MFKRSGVLQVTYFNKGLSVDNKSYIDLGLKLLVGTLKSLRPTYGAKIMKFYNENDGLHVHFEAKRYPKDKTS